MNHLFDQWDQVIDRMRGATKIGLFLDFDGTLVKFRQRPDQVRLKPVLRNTLAALADSRRVRVTIISGRRRDDVAARAGIPGVRYLGLHGAEGRRDAPNPLPETRNALRTMQNLLDDVLPMCPGVWVEDKGDILTIHYRDSQSPAQVEPLVRSIAARFSKWIRLSAGKKIWELIPYELEDKGNAVRHELRSLGWLTVPVYIGDDAGDEPAFAALHHGVTVRVGAARRSFARYRLSNVEQVWTFLTRMRMEFA